MVKEARRQPRPVWRLEGDRIDLGMALTHLCLNPDLLLRDAGTLMPDGQEAAFLEFPTFFLEDSGTFLEVLQQCVTRGHEFRLLLRAAEGIGQGMVQAWPPLDPDSLDLLRGVNPGGAHELDRLTQRMEAMLATLLDRGAPPFHL